MEPKVMTVEDAVKAIYEELRQVSVPAELTFSIGVHVGRATMIAADMLRSFEQQKAAEEAKKEQDNIVELPVEGSNDA